MFPNLGFSRNWRIERETSSAFFHHELWLTMSKVFVPSSGLLLNEILAIQPQPLKLPEFHGQVDSTTDTPHICPGV